MPIVQKTLEEHVEEAKANLLDQFKQKPNLEKLLEIYVRQIEDAERVAFELKEERFITTSVGEQLDGIGQIVGEARQGRTDPEYRVAIATRINLNLSSGRREDIIRMILGVVGATTTVQIIEYFPAAFLAQILDPVNPLFDASQVGLFVKSAKAAGVNGITTFGVAGSYQFDIGPGLDLGLYGGAV